MPHWTLPHQPASAAAGRALVQQVADGHPAADDAVLAASELLGNAVRHGHGDIQLVVEQHGPTLHVAVSVEADKDPTPRTPDADAESGRGLGIVDSLATRWGWDRAGTVVRLWAEFGA